jgi:4-diphosphocytidyl-2-C-methyl-D-erythritol kinase
LISWIEEEDLKSISLNMKNVLENVTLRKHYLLKEIKKEMLKLEALGSMMSGSGPTVFAFFDDMLKAQNCYNKMREKYNEVYITRTI